MIKPVQVLSDLTENIKAGGIRLGTTLASRFIRAAPGEPALPPGTLIYQGTVRTEKVRLTVIDYGPDHHDVQELQTPEDALPYKITPSTTWINVSGVHEVSVIESFGKNFGIHPLVLEDIVHTSQRPKVEDHGSYLYLVLKMLQYKSESGQIESEQVSLVLGKGWILSFQEKDGDVFDPVRERIKNVQSRLRRFSADYLAYALIDAIVDHYFLALEKVGDKIEDLEDLVQHKPSSDLLRQIHQLKREMIYMRKSIWPLREVINQLYKGEMPLVKEPIRIYLRDVYDHTIQIIETVESFRDMLSGVQDLYLSVLSQRMNEVMKVLTIIATIFIPPTFVAGIYGMNFDHMPELHTAGGYFIVLGVMAASILSMLIFFRRKGWI